MLHKIQSSDEKRKSEQKDGLSNIRRNPRRVVCTTSLDSSKVWRADVIERKLRAEFGPSPGGVSRQTNRADSHYCNGQPAVSIKP